MSWSREVNKNNCFHFKISILTALGELTGRSKSRRSRRPIRRLLQKVLVINAGLSQYRLLNFGPILMVEMKGFIQRFNVKCQGYL